MKELRTIKQELIEMSEKTDKLQAALSSSLRPREVSDLMRICSRLVESLFVSVCSV